MIVGGYILDLYCEVEGCDAHLRVAEPAQGAARIRARELHWTVKVTANECYCPRHKQSSKDLIR